jgi:hypothetical protein
LWFEFFSDDTVRFGDIGASALDMDLRTSQVFRDPSSWGHLVFAVDTTQATASNRVKIYWNGTQITAFSTSTYPTQNFDTRLNTTSAHGIGRAGSYNAQYFSGYLADIYFIDGQALTPSSFTETDATTGQLIPKAYTGSYGTNGFRLTFADNSAATATTLGKDAAGSNNWTPNNLSVTAGAGNDSLVDVPTNGAQTDTGVGGEVRGNYCTLNPLDRSSNITLTNGNLDFSNTTAGNVRSTFAVKGVKIYCETSANTAGNWGIGIGKASSSLAGNFAAGISGVYGWNWGGGIANFHSNGSYPWNVSAAASDVFQLAIDASNPASVKLFLGRQNTWYDSSGGTTANPATGANPTATLTDNVDWFVFTGGANATNSVSVNFGQRPFAYTAPSGFKALCTANLPAPAIVRPSSVFNAVLYTGTGGARTITGVGFDPDLVWNKERSATGAGPGHRLADSVRGANKNLATHLTSAEYDPTTLTQGGLGAVTTDGFTIVAGTTGANNANNLNSTYVAWAWDAGTTTTTNTVGSISSQVRANASAGFSVVTYTGSGANSTIGHGLGVPPQFFITKNRSSSAFNWGVYHASAGNTGYLKLNLTDAFATQATWQNTTPTSAVFYVGNFNSANQGGDNYVAYCFAPVVGYSSFGSYTGNGSADGPFVYTGFRPRWIMVKRSDSTGNWTIKDTSRPGYNVTNLNLFSNLSIAETTEYPVDLLSNGFKVREGTFSDWNTNGGTYVWAAFAESPFQYARAR